MKMREERCQKGGGNRQPGLRRTAQEFNLISTNGKWKFFPFLFTSIFWHGRRWLPHSILPSHFSRKQLMRFRPSSNKFPHFKSLFNLISSKLHVLHKYETLIIVMYILDGHYFVNFYVILNKEFVNNDVISFFRVCVC